VDRRLGRFFGAWAIHHSTMVLGECQMNDDDFDPDSRPFIIGLCAAALSGAIVGCIGGSLGAVLFMMWRF
jgi:hypothetical protein